MATSDVKVTEGSGKNVASYSISEDAETKQIQRIVTNNSTGTEILTSSNPGQVTGANGTFPATQSGTWTVQPGNTANTTAWKVDGSAVTQPVSGTVSTTPSKSSTGTESNVSGSATDVTVLASNANRFGGSVYNDSTATLYLLLANATSSATNYSVQLQPNAYFEIPFSYTGVLKGIWSSATGTARVMEYT